MKVMNVHSSTQVCFGLLKKKTVQRAFYTVCFHTIGVQDSFSALANKVSGACDFQ